MYVYLPPGYDREHDEVPGVLPAARRGGDEDAWTKMGRANIIIDNLIAAGKASR